MPSRIRMDLSRFTGLHPVAPITFSDEQKRIIEHVSATTSNVYVDAVAGSGKTTTVIGIAQAMPQCPLLLVTYNAMLKKEVKAKMQKYGVSDRVTVHNYHSLAVHYYDRDAHTDERLEDVIHRDATLSDAGRALPVAILVVDEVQDMTLLYYRLLLKFVRDKGVLGDVRVVLLGDVNQAVYDFKGADSRFLRMAGQCFAAMTRHPFAALTLRETYRCPKPVAQFVNTVMLGEDRMHAAALVHHSSVVEYVRYNSCIPGGGKGTERVVNYLVRLVREDGARAGDIFVLAPSVNNCQVASELENELCGRFNVPTYVSTDDKANDEECMRGKLIITTYHRSKGLERPFVILLGFDLSYLLIYGKDKTHYACPRPRPCPCPCALYVAATRASRRLVVVEDMAFGPLPFLHTQKLCMDGESESQGQDQDQEGGRVCKTTVLCGNDKPVKYLRFKATMGVADVDTSHACIPSQVVKYLSDDVYVNVERMLEHIATRASVPGSVCVNLCHRAESTVCHSAEDVSNLNGIAVPFMFEALRPPGPDQVGASTMPRLLQSALVKVGTLREGKLQREIAAHLENVSTACAHIAAHGPLTEPLAVMIPTFLRLANITHALDTRYVSQLRQVKSYTWLSASDVEQCHAHMASILPGEDVSVDWEYRLHGSVIRGPVEFRCDGYIDAVCPQFLWEFKCVQNLTTEHVLQLCLYMWMWDRLPQGRTMRGPRKGRLVNVRTGQMITLTDDGQQGALNVDDPHVPCTHDGRHRTVLDSIVDYVLHVKFTATSVMSDAEFVQAVTRTSNQTTHCSRPPNTT